jgi:hypothetical protein
MFYVKKSASTARVFEPVSVRKTVNQAALEIRNVAGHSLNVGAGNSFDNDAVSGPTARPTSSARAVNGKRPIVAATKYRINLSG